MDGAASKVCCVWHHDISKYNGVIFLLLNVEYFIEIPFDVSNDPSY